VVPQFENALRDDRHVVEGSGGKIDEKAVGLKYKIREDIVIVPNDPAAPRSSQPAAAITSPAKTAKGGGS
jgi:hypothetical protein